MVGGDGAVSQKCQYRHDYSLHLHVVLIILPGKQVFSKVLGHLTLQREVRLSPGRFKHAPYSFSLCAPITCGRNHGVLYGLYRRTQGGGGVVQFLVTKIIDVIVKMKTGRWCTTLSSCWCSNGNLWVPIINVPLENQGVVMVAAVVSQIPKYGARQRSFSPP